ncbi:MAG: T9SS type A sorting domain-containing protein [Bacteroidia bacterium]
MKNKLTLLLLAIASLSFAQSFKIKFEGKDVTGTVYNKKVASGDFSIIDFDLQNTSNDDKNYKVSRTVKSPSLLGDCYTIQICAGKLCYNTNGNVVDTLKESFPFPANSTLPKPGTTGGYGMSVHFNVCDNACEDHTIVYRIWDVAKPTDFAEVTVNYTCSTGIKEYDLGDISPGYPNPAKGLITIDYNLKNAPKNAKVVFYDMLGKMVKETPIANQQGAVKINVADLHTGFYFYNFIVDGKTSNARKLIISAN